MKNQYDQKFYKENGFVLIKNLLTTDGFLTNSTQKEMDDSIDGILI
jgi:hypothetical protein